MQKEDVYAILAFSVVGVIILVVVVLRHFLGLDLVPFIRPLFARTLVGVLLAVAASLVCALNFFLHFVSPRLYKKEHGSMEGYDEMSGLPVVSGFFVLGAGALMPESTFTGGFLLALFALDPNGVPWFFLRLLRGRGRLGS